MSARKSTPATAAKTPHRNRGSVKAAQAKRITALKKQVADLKAQLAAENEYSLRVHSIYADRWRAADGLMWDKALLDQVVLELERRGPRPIDDPERHFLTTALIAWRANPANAKKGAHHSRDYLRTVALDAWNRTRPRAIRDVRAVIAECADAKLPTGRPLRR